MVLAFICETAKSPQNWKKGRKVSVARIAILLSVASLCPGGQTNRQTDGRNALVFGFSWLPHYDPPSRTGLLALLWDSLLIDVRSTGDAALSSATSPGAFEAPGAATVVVSTSNEEGPDGFSLAAESS